MPLGGEVTLRIPGVGGDIDAFPLTINACGTFLLQLRINRGRDSGSEKCASEYVLAGDAPIIVVIRNDFTEAAGICVG